MAEEKCPECDGSGEINIVALDNNDSDEIIECELCNGTGVWDA